MAREANNYTLGRGEVYFARFNAGTQTPGGERYLGNTPEFNLTIESEDLDHFSSDRGIREKDDSIVLEVMRMGTLITDNISPENVALFFFGDTSTVTQTAVTGATETIMGASPGLFFQLGQSPSNPVGVRGISNLTVTISGGPALVAGTDYIVEADLGRIAIPSGSAIPPNSTLNLEYDIAGSTTSRVISGSNPVEGAMRFIPFNPKGRQISYYMPWVKLSPNGDFALKGEEWQQIPFNIEVLRLTGVEAIYADDQPVFLS